MTYLQQVEQFHKQFDAPILPYPQFPTDRWAFRVALLEEELEELREACRTGNLVEVADALGDLQFVLSGAVLEFGMKEVFDPMFKEITRSNLSKSCPSMDVAMETEEFYRQKGIPTYIRKVNDVWNVYHATTHKVLKNIQWSAPNLEPFLTLTENGNTSESNWSGSGKNNS